MRSAGLSVQAARAQESSVCAAPTTTHVSPRLASPALVNSLAVVAPCMENGFIPPVCTPGWSESSHPDNPCPQREISSPASPNPPAPSSLPAPMCPSPAGSSTPKQILLSCCSNPPVHPPDAAQEVEILQDQPPLLPIRKTSTKVLYLSVK